MGSHTWQTSDRTATVPRMLTGMCQVIIFFQIINRQPKRSSKALTSPSEPPVIPRNISLIEGNWESTEASPVVMACFITLKGVAAVSASTSDACSTGQVVICAGKLMSRNTRPTRAGLKGLQPSPPKVSLPTPMATRAPKMIIHTTECL